MNNQHIPEGLLDKLNKLKNLQEGAASVGSLAEAEVAAQKYMELLMKFNLTEEAVINHGVQAKLQMLCSEVDLKQYFAYTASDWADKLVRKVAYYCMCKAVGHCNNTISILGEKQNVATALYLIEQIVSKVHIAFKHAWRDYRGEENQKMFRRGFLIGAVESIAVKLSEQQEVMNKANTGMELMIVNKRELATKFMHQKFPNTVSARSRSGQGLSGIGGYQRGVEAGKGIGLNKGVQGGHPGSKRLE